MGKEHAAGLWTFPLALDLFLWMKYNLQLSIIHTEIWPLLGTVFSLNLKELVYVFVIEKVYEKKQILLLLWEQCSHSAVFEGLANVHGAMQYWWSEPGLPACRKRALLHKLHLHYSKILKLQWVNFIPYIVVGFKWKTFLLCILWSTCFMLFHVWVKCGSVLEVSLQLFVARLCVNLTLAPVVYLYGPLSPDLWVDLSLSSQHFKPDYPLGCRPSFLKKLVPLLGTNPWNANTVFWILWESLFCRISILTGYQVVIENIYGGNWGVNRLIYPWTWEWEEVKVARSDNLNHP